LGTLAAGLSGVYSIRVLTKLVPVRDMPAPLRHLFIGLRALYPRATKPAN